MTDDPTRRRATNKLGRGLSALLGDEEEDQAQLDRLRQTRSLPVERLTPGPFQPRRRFDAEDLAELAESIREQGVLQPVLVRRAPDGDSYEIIAGERRWRAAQLAQLHEIPVLVREFDDRTAMEIALVENVQRRDLTALEEADGYHRLIEEYGHSQEEVARAVGKSRSHVANTLRLLNLPGEVRTLLEDGQLTAGHARTLIGHDDAVALAREVVTRKLNVRDTERLVQRSRMEPSGGAGPARPRATPARPAAACRQGRRYPGGRARPSRPTGPGGLDRPRPRVRRRQRDRALRRPRPARPGDRATVGDCDRPGRARRG